MPGDLAEAVVTAVAVDVSLDLYRLTGLRQQATRVPAATFEVAVQALERPALLDKGTAIPQPKLAINFIRARAKPPEPDQQQQHHGEYTKDHAANLISAHFDPLQEESILNPATVVISVVAPPWPRSLPQIGVPARPAQLGDSDLGQALAEARALLG